MTIQEIYDLAIDMGIKADPRGEKAVHSLLAKKKKGYGELSEKKKRFFDEESLHNPYSDTRIIFGDTKKQVKKILAGIDAMSSDVLLFDRLNEKGAGFDLLIGHHPLSGALANIHDVMALQTDVAAQIGVQENIADALMRERMSEIQTRFHPVNHNHVRDTAALLNVPLLTLHTVWDNLSDQFLKNYLKDQTFDTVGDVLEYLQDVPEYVESQKGKAGPLIVAGSASSRPGKIGVFFTGGTNPAKEMYHEWAKAGIGTSIDMHMPEEAIKEMKKLRVNVINAGHMASDSIGANIFFDALENKGIEVVACSGLIRVKRGGKK